MIEQIKIYWEALKDKKIENQLLFVEDNNEYISYKISINENEFSGELNLSYIREIANSLNGKEVIAVHNHPTELPKPSYPDFFQMQYLESILRLCNIKLKDYIIVSPYGFLSFLDEGLMIKSDFHSPLLNQNIISKDFPYEIFKDNFDECEELLKTSINYSQEGIIGYHQLFLSQQFSGSFLLSLEEKLYNQCIFIINKNSYSKQRLKDINNLLSPIEIYSFEDGVFLPLKINGCL